MQREGAGTGILHAQGDLHRRARFFIPAGAGLDGDRQVRRANHRANDPVDEIQVLEAARATVALHDLFYRAAKVDVDEFRLVVLGDQSRRFRHGVRIGAVDLDPDRSLTGLELGPLERGTDPAPDGLRGKKLGQHHIRPQVPTDLPERSLGDARHGREHERKRVRGRIGQLHGGKILDERPRV